MRVQPLEVVDRDHQRLTVGQSAQDVEQAERDRPQLGWRADRIGTQNGNLERPPLRARQGIELLASDLVEEVDERRKREPRVGAARPRAEHMRPGRTRRDDPGFPERGLAEPGPADQDERPGAIRAVKEVVQQSELRLSPDRLRPPPFDGCHHVPRWA